MGDVSTIAQANGRPVLQITDVKQPTVDNNGNTRTAPRCIGCHVGTPDGDYVAFVDFWPWSVAFADVTTNNGATVGRRSAGLRRRHLHQLEHLPPTCAQGSTCQNGKIIPGAVGRPDGVLEGALDIPGAASGSGS